MSEGGLYEITQHPILKAKLKETEKENAELKLDYDTATTIAAEYGLKIREMRKAMQTFVDRVEDGSIKSTKTYNQFKEILR